MNEWTTCPHCGLAHSMRADGACPRCRRVPTAGAAPATVTTAGVAVASTSAPAPGAKAPAKPKLTALSAAGGVVGAALGIGGSRYFGSALLFPGVFAFATGLVITKLGPARARPFVLALCPLVGQIGWMAAGAVITRMWEPIALDVILLGAGALWLASRPGLAPVIALAVLEILSIGANGLQLASQVDVASQKALVLHLILRGLVLAGLAAGYAKHRKDARNLSMTTLGGTFE